MDSYSIIVKCTKAGTEKVELASVLVLSNQQVCQIESLCFSMFELKSKILIVLLQSMMNAKLCYQRFRLSY